MAGTDPAGTTGPTHRPVAVRSRPAWGVDAPGTVIALAGFVVFGTFGGIFVGSAAGADWALLFWAVALVCGLAALAMYLGSTAGKPRLWAAIVEGLDLRGDEVALDLGCGRGVAAVAVARRCPDGHMTGIDLWKGREQAGNQATMTELNLRATGVSDRVVVRDGDLRAPAAEPGSVDLVTAGLSLGSLGAEDRRRAAAAVAGVLRPGGRVVVVDRGRTDAIAAALSDAGLAGMDVTGRRWLLFPPVRVLTAAKP